MTHLDPSVLATVTGGTLSSAQPAQQQQPKAQQQPLKIQPLQKVEMPELGPPPKSIPLGPFTPSEPKASLSA
ncbi:MAG TPA: hypothetical protein VH165_23495 [Kofleriaceae bacterium]|jgi:hypothetical protein|nr:hypothetical protein [Kofleriaceae bacterium]